MRQAVKTKSPTKSRISRSISFPAPVGGWNARDSLAAMKPYEAVVLENWFPKPSYCEMRGGKQTHATSMTGIGKTLAVYNAMSGTRKMFCTTSSGVYDVSSAGAVGASVAARTNGKHQHLMFGDGTNHYLILVNGEDKPLYYDGTTWIAVDGASSPALTGLTTTQIVSVFEFKGRLIFIEKGSLSFWYLASGAAGGALTEFSLEGVAKRGGYLMAGASWTMDAGDGPDDRAVFVTSEGEAIVYSGNNPSSSTSWALTGRFDLGKPLGRRCFEKVAGDLLVITENGIFPLSSGLISSGYNKTASVTDKINSAFNDAARSHGSNFGWMAINYPAQSAMLFNVPIAEDGEHEQYVMNTTTKSWCKFTNWDAECFTVFGGELYYASGTTVYKAWTGTADVNTQITAYGKSAFTAFGDTGLQKRINMYRPVLSVNGTLTFLTDIDVDFNETIMTGQTLYSVTAEAKWDTAIWDISYWTSGMEVVKEWTSPDENFGYYISGKIKVVTNNVTVQWLANDYIYEVGGAI